MSSITLERKCGGLTYNLLIQNEIHTSSVAYTPHPLHNSSW